MRLVHGPIRARQMLVLSILPAMLLTVSTFEFEIRNNKVSSVESDMYVNILVG